MREPLIIVLGRKLEVLDVLKTELEKFDRKIHTANSKKLLEIRLEKQQYDFAVMGAGLPDQERAEIQEFWEQNCPDKTIHLIPKTPDSNPYKMIDFANEKAILWKVEQTLINHKSI